MEGEHQNVSIFIYKKNLIFLKQDWIFDAICAYFKSASWQSPVQSFIECNCVYFTKADPIQDNY